MPIQPHCFQNGENSNSWLKKTKKQNTKRVTTCLHPPQEFDKTKDKNQLIWLHKLHTMKYTNSWLECRECHN